MKDMRVKDLIAELQKLPPDDYITFQDYDNHFEAKVCWDITMEERKNSYEDEPYIYLTKIQ
jgi:hypothetical protein